MKKLLLMPAFVLFMTGATSIKFHRTEVKHEPAIVPLNVKVDSINIKAQELNKLINKL